VALPKVTVACHCGERLQIPYGERQRCRCGRTWDTGQIPEADYQAVLDTARRFRRNEVAFALVALGLVATLIFIGRYAPVYITIPVFILVWIRWFRPWWRLRKQARLRDLPVWNLRSEGGPDTPG